jgi:hypothetical protein
MDEFCDLPLGSKVGGVVGEEELVRCLHTIAYDRRRIVQDFFIVGIWTRRDMEGGTPRCRVGVGRLYEVDKVVGAVLVVTKFVK